MSHEKDTYAGEYALYRHDNEVRAPLEAEIEKLRTRLAAAEEQVNAVLDLNEYTKEELARARADLAAARQALAAAEEQVRQWSQDYDRLLADRQGHEACAAEMNELREALDDTWDNFRRVAGEANELTADLAAARRALAEQVSHRAGCCWTWGQGCDCGSVDALLAPERPREERG